MKKVDFFMTSKFDAAEIQKMREQVDKPKVLFDIGQRLRMIRKNQNRERSALAVRCGVSADQLGRFEHGMRDIGFAALDRYSDELGVDLCALLSPYLGGDAAAARVVVDLARGWVGEGKALSIEDVVGIAAAP